MPVAEIRPEPEPVRLHPKVLESVVSEAWVVSEACLDAPWEALYEGDPDGFLAAFEDMCAHVVFVKRLRDKDGLGDWDSVQFAKKSISDDENRAYEEIGRVAVRLKGAKKAERQALRKEIRKRIKQAERLRAAWLDCRRWEKELFDRERDQDAAQRLAAGERRGAK